MPIYISWLGGLIYLLFYIYEGRNTHFDMAILSWTGTLQWQPLNLVLLYIKFSLLIIGLVACIVVVVCMITRVSQFFS